MDHPLLQAKFTDACGVHEPRIVGPFMEITLLTDNQLVGSLEASKYVDIASYAPNDSWSVGKDNAPYSTITIGVYEGGAENSLASDHRRASYLFDAITEASYYGMIFRHLLSTNIIARLAAETLVRLLRSSIKQSGIEADDSNTA